ncbi:hypothetical protein ACSBPH_13230 [Microbacterium sp. F51-2R]|uniref:DUF4190 domain-containing protein n=1 Tax=Microbacterium sp. F51-2R TaxID=3445777 RepID=UPI003FA02EB0
MSGSGDGVGGGVESRGGDGLERRGGLEPEPSGRPPAHPPILKPPPPTRVLPVSNPEAAPTEARSAAPSLDPTPAPPSAQAVDPAGSEPVLPGAHRGGFQRLPTGPVGITSQSAPPDPDGEQSEPLVQWAMPVPKPRGFLAGWALGFSVVGLVVSIFVGWGFPLGIAGIVAAILALRRPLESRGIAIWAIVLGGVSLLYSAGWLVFAAFTSGLAG